MRQPTVTLARAACRPRLPAAVARAATLSGAALLALSGAALLALSGCRRAEPDHQPPAPGGVAAAPEPGEPTAATARSARTPLYELRVLGVEECGTAPGARPVGGARPAPGLRPVGSVRRLGVELALSPTTDLQVPANPYYARLLDEHRQLHDATLGGCGPALSPTLPGRGQTARGFVVFEVPRASRHFTLLYAPELVGAPKQELSIALGP